MKQKIIIKAKFHCIKCRSKAMKIAAKAPGVTSVAIEGDEKDEIVIIGETVDAAALAFSIRNKIGYATLELVHQLN